MSPKNLVVALTSVAGLTGAGVLWISLKPMGAVEMDTVSVTPSPRAEVSAPAVGSAPEALLPAQVTAKKTSESEDESSELKQPELENVTLPEYAANNTNYPTLGMRMEEIQARRDGVPFDAQAVLAAMHQPTAWTPDDSIADELPLTDEEKTDGREFIRFTPLKVESLVPGDTMELPIWQTNANYQMVVDRVEAHGDGNVTWHGHLKDFEGDNQVSITRGETLTYGGITTPDGLFVLEARSDKGWIANSSTLAKGEDLHIEVTAGPDGQPVVQDHQSHAHDSSSQHDQPEVM